MSNSSYGGGIPNTHSHSYTPVMWSAGATMLVADLEAFRKWQKRELRRVNREEKLAKIVKNPDHYAPAEEGGMECIAAIRSMLGVSAYIDHCRAAVVKYTWRLMDKGDPLANAKKAREYLDYIIRELDTAEEVADAIQEMAGGNSDDDGQQEEEHAANVAQRGGII